MDNKKGLQLIMDQIKQQSQQVVSDPQTCRDTICRYCYSFYSCFTDYLECDRRFLPMSIIPYQLYHLKQQNPLIRPIDKNSSRTFEFNRVPQDSMLTQPQQSSRWQQVKTCDWWKKFLCCPYPQDEQMEMETDYDLKQSRFVEDQKKLKSGENYSFNNGQKAFAKGATHDQDDIIFLDDEMHDDGISVYEMQNNNNLVILFAQPVKVNQKQQLGDIGIKRKSKTNSNQTNSNSGQDIFSPILKSKATEQSRKISSDLTLSSCNDNIPEYPKYSNPNLRTQSFDQSSINHQSSIKKNKQDDSSVTNGSNINTSNLQNDQTMKKKKRNNNNPFEHINDPQYNYNAVQEKAPQDLSKKRRKRRKDVNQDQKQKEERAYKREKEDLQVVIFQDDQT